MNARVSDVDEYVQAKYVEKQNNQLQLLNFLFATGWSKDVRFLRTELLVIALGEVGFDRFVVATIDLHRPTFEFIIGSFKSWIGLHSRQCTGYNGRPHGKDRNDRWGLFQLQNGPVLGFFLQQFSPSLLGGRVIFSKNKSNGIAWSIGRLWIIVVNSGRWSFGSVETVFFHEFHSCRKRRSHLRKGSLVCLVDKDRWVDRGWLKRDASKYPYKVQAEEAQDD